jgi:hypothetical protein
MGPNQEKWGESKEKDVWSIKRDPTTSPSGVSAGMGKRVFGDLSLHIIAEAHIVLHIAGLDEM